MKLGGFELPIFSTFLENCTAYLSKGSPGKKNQEVALNSSVDLLSLLNQMLGQFLICNAPN